MVPRLIGTLAYISVHPPVCLCFCFFFLFFCLSFSLFWFLFVSFCPPPVIIWEPPDSSLDPAPLQDCSDLPPGWPQHWGERGAATTHTSPPPTSAPPLLPPSTPPSSCLLHPPKHLTTAPPFPPLSRFHYRCKRYPVLIFFAPPPSPAPPPTPPPLNNTDYNDASVDQCITV